MVNSPAKKKAKTSNSTSASPPPDMSILHAPTARGWGKTEWTHWSNGMDAQIDQLRVDEDEKFNALIDVSKAAMRWAAPEEITVKISLNDEPDRKCEENGDEMASAEPKTCMKSQEIVISKTNDDTFRSILDRFCKQENIERDDYNWVHKCDPGAVRYYYQTISLLNHTDFKCFYELWSGHPPTLVSRFVDETTFLPEIVGTRKVPPKPKPSAPPSFKKLKSLPPDGNASSGEWDKWHKKNCGGSLHFWIEKEKAVRYSCPDEIEIVLKGISHEHTVKVNAWEPLSEALISYCASTTGTDFAVTPPEVILRNYGDEPKFIDAQVTSPQMQFNGYQPLKMEVVHRDPNRTKVDLETIHGPTPEGYRQFLGAGYGLSDTEQPWLISQEHGIDSYNKIGKALMLYKGDSWRPRYNLQGSWFKMTGKVKVVLGEIVRKPSDGWSVESIDMALDGLTAALVNLFYNDNWRGIDKEAVSVLRKMDNCAVAVVNAASEYSTTPESPAQLGTERSLEQLKRLMGKYKKKYSWLSEDGHDYRGHVPFKKSFPLIN